MIEYKCKVYTNPKAVAMIKERLKQRVARRREEMIHNLVESSLTPEGTEARKKIKQLMTTKVLSSAERSARTGKLHEDKQHRVKASSKTDATVNSYFKAKHGDLLPRTSRGKRG